MFFKRWYEYCQRCAYSAIFHVNIQFFRGFDFSPSISPFSVSSCQEPVFVNVYGAQESIPPAYVAWLAGTTNRVVVTARQARNRFLGSVKGLPIRALVPSLVLMTLWTLQHCQQELWTAEHEKCTLCTGWPRAQLHERSEALLPSPPRGSRLHCLCCRRSVPYYYRSLVIRTLIWAFHSQLL